MKILIVESERSLLHAMGRYFSSLGISVESAFDGVIAGNAFTDDTDLAIVDANVPRIEPIALIENLKKKKPSLKAALIINEFAISHQLLIENRCVDEFLTKPFLVNELAWLIAHANEEKKDEGPFLTYKEIFMDEKTKGGKISLSLNEAWPVKREEIREYEIALAQKFAKNPANNI